MVGELLLHIVVAIGHMQGKGAGTVFLIHKISSLLHEHLAGLELFPVVIADDVGRFGGGFIARHFAEVEEALIALGVGGSFGGGQQADKFRQQQGRVLHFVFGTTGVDIEPPHLDRRRRGIEVFILDLAQLAAIHGIGFLGREAIHAEAVGAAADLLIGGETDGNGTMLYLGVSQQVLAQGNDLRHTGFIIGAQQGGAIGDNKLLAEVFLQEGIIGGGKGGSAQLQ